MQRVHPEDKPWLHNFLLYADKTQMSEKDKGTWTYLWSLFVDDPKVSVLKTQHAILITEWAINL